MDSPLVIVLDNAKLGKAEALRAHSSKDGRSWNMLPDSAQVYPTEAARLHAIKMIKADQESGVYDLEEHLNNPAHDFFNTTLLGDTTFDESQQRGTLTLPLNAQLPSRRANTHTRTLNPTPHTQQFDLTMHRLRKRRLRLWCRIQRRTDWTNIFFHSYGAVKRVLFPRMRVRGGVITARCLASGTTRPTETGGGEPLSRPIPALRLSRWHREESLQGSVLRPRYLPLIPRQSSRCVLVMPARKSSRRPHRLS